MIAVVQRVSEARVSVEATGYGVEPPQVPMEHSVFPAEQYAYAETLDRLQGLSPDARTIKSAIALERSTKNPQFFNDDVAPTLTTCRTAPRTGRALRAPRVAHALCGRCTRSLARSQG